MTVRKDALRFIAGYTHDTLCWELDCYRKHGGGYQGLQAVAEAALLDPELDPDIQGYSVLAIIDADGHITKRSVHPDLLVGPTDHVVAVAFDELIERHRATR